MSRRHHLSLPWVHGGFLGVDLFFWHWPVYQALNESSGLTGATLDLARAAVALLIAVVSFYLVEQPIRRGGPLGFRLSPRRLVVAAPVAVGAAVVLVLSSTAGATKPLLVEDGQQFKVLVGQLVHDGFAGDSVARLMAPGLVDIAKRNGWGLVSAAFDGCSVGGFEQAGAQDNASVNRCPGKVATAQQRLVNGYAPSVIFVYSRWDLDTAYGPDHALAAGTAEQEKVVVDHWRTALSRLTSRGATVVWLDLMPGGPEVCKRIGRPHLLRDTLTITVLALVPYAAALWLLVRRGTGARTPTPDDREQSPAQDPHGPR